MIKALVLAVGCSLAFFLTHVAIFASYRVQERFKIMNRVAALFLFGYALLFFLTPTESWWTSKVLQWTPSAWHVMYSATGFVVGLFIYTMLYIGYLEFYFTADRSMSVRILRELHAKNSMSLDDINEVYDVQVYYARRYEEMITSGYLEAVQGVYRLTSKGRRVARIYDCFIHYLHLEGG